MKCRTHGNRACALCALDDIKKGDEDAYITLITLSFALAAFIIGVAIYY